MPVAFDPAKDEENRAKHGTSLAFAETVLADPNRIDVLDVRHDYGEDRFVAFALAEGRV